MDMQIDAQLIRNERLRRAWSQEQLAQVTGLGIRTVQRIENGGNASLETVKALAAVLELQVEAILVAAPSQSNGAVCPPSRFRLFRPWHTFATGFVASLVAMGSFFAVQGAFAQKVALDFAVTLNDEQISVRRVTSEGGSPAVVEIRDLFRINLVPTVAEDGFILVKAEIYAMQDGKFELLATPSLTVKDGSQAMISTGGEQTRLDLLLTPTIE